MSFGKALFLLTLLKTFEMDINTFRNQILEGIPSEIPGRLLEEKGINHAPKRKQILSEDERRLAIQNALRYFPKHQHEALAFEFLEELNTLGRIYMLRYRPEYSMYARPISDYPGECEQAKAIMLMIQNNLDHAVAQHPHELITYGGNGAVFQNWAQYRLTMKYLAEMTDEQTLVCILVIQWDYFHLIKMHQELLLQME